jgi:hypothetical protein
MVTSAPSGTTITITMPSNEGGAGATTSGGITYFQYYHVGPAEQVGVFGYGISQWGGTVTNPQTTTLNGALNADSAGTGGTGTTINVASTTGFPSTGTNFIQVDNEEISYTGLRLQVLQESLEMLEEQLTLLTAMVQQLLILVLTQPGVKQHRPRIK